MKCLVCYDIVDNSRRRQVDRTMCSFGVRVQRSVFETVLSKAEYGRMISVLREIVDTNCDSVRIYMLCDRCRTKIEILGLGKIYENLGYVII